MQIYLLLLETDMQVLTAGYKSYWHLFLKDAFHHFYTVPVEQTAADYIQICSIQMFL